MWGVASNSLPCLTWGLHLDSLHFQIHHGHDQAIRCIDFNVNQQVPPPVSNQSLPLSPTSLETLRPSLDLVSSPCSVFILASQAPLTLSSLGQYQMVTGGDDGCLRYWDIRDTSKPLKAFQHHSHW